jgi:hypothetical protein
MKLCDLEPNPDGHTSPLPKNYRSKEEIQREWNERMEWPENYSALNPGATRYSRYGGSSTL